MHASEAPTNNFKNNNNNEAWKSWFLFYNVLWPSVRNIIDLFNTKKMVIMLVTMINDISMILPLCEKS